MFTQILLFLLRSVRVCVIVTLGGIRLMPVNVSIVKNGNHQYIRVCQSYCNEKGQPTSRVIENHGRLDLALLKDPQYVEKLRERVKQQNELEKKTKIELIEKQAAEQEYYGWEK